jgi:Rrf2 family protein
MRLTTKMRYGTRVMLELALHYSRGPLSLAGIAQRQELSEKYIESLVSALRTAGLVQAVRGANGGYVLARPPDDINLRQIYDVLEGPEGYAPCTNDQEACQRFATCVTQEVWVEMYRASMRVLDNKTLADLAQEYDRKQAATAAVYTI